MHKVAVIGLGRLGMTLARQLGAAGVEVIAIDRNGALVDEVKEDVTVAVRLDSTDESALASQDVAHVDVCVVSIGENFEAALLTASIVKKMGVKRIICRAQTSVHAEIFRRLGADEIIQPETQAGVDLARKLSNPQLEDYIKLAGGYSLVEMRAPAAFYGKTLEQIGLRNKYQVNLVALKRVSRGMAGDPSAKAEEIYVPTPGQVITEDDIMVLVGSDEAISSLPRDRARKAV